MRTGQEKVVALAQRNGRVDNRPMTNGDRKSINAILAECGRATGTPPSVGVTEQDVQRFNHYERVFRSEMSRLETRGGKLLAHSHRLAMARYALLCIAVSLAFGVTFLVNTHHPALSFSIGVLLGACIAAQMAVGWRYDHVGMKFDRNIGQRKGTMRTLSLVARKDFPEWPAPQEDQEP